MPNAVQSASLAGSDRRPDNHGHNMPQHWESAPPGAMSGSPKGLRVLGPTGKVVPNQTNFGLALENVTPRRPGVGSGGVEAPVARATTEE